MKKLFVLALFVSTIICSCKKDENGYSLRVKNERDYTIPCKVSGSNYGQLTSGYLTKFKDVPSSTLNISTDITCSIPLPSDDKSKLYTLILDGSGVYRVVTGYYNEIRIANHCEASMHIILGGTDFGIVQSRNTTMYKWIPFGRVYAGGELSGYADFPTEIKTDHNQRYTLEVNSSFDFYLWWDTHYTYSDN